MTLDPDRPLASLLEATGISQHELARRLGISQPAVAQALTRGDDVGLAWLRRAVQAAGKSLELRARRPKNKST